MAFEKRAAVRAKARQKTSTGGTAPQLVALVPQAAGKARDEAVATIYPEKKPGKHTSILNIEVSRDYVNKARTVLEWAPELAAAVLPSRARDQPGAGRILPAARAPRSSARITATVGYRQRRYTRSARCCSGCVNGA